MTRNRKGQWLKLKIVGGVIGLALLPLFGIPGKIYLTLTIAGIAMGMLIFLMAYSLLEARDLLANFSE